MNRQFCVWSSDTHNNCRAVVFGGKSAGRMFRSLGDNDLVRHVDLTFDIVTHNRTNAGVLWNRSAGSLTKTF